MQLPSRLFLLKMLVNYFLLCVPNGYVKLNILVHGEQMPAGTSDFEFDLLRYFKMWHVASYPRSSSLRWCSV